MLLSTGAGAISLLKAPLHEITGKLLHAFVRPRNQHSQLGALGGQPRHGDRDNVMRGPGRRGLFSPMPTFPGKGEGSKSPSHGFKDTCPAGLPGPRKRPVRIMSYQPRMLFSGEAAKRSRSDEWHKSGQEIKCSQTQPE